MLRRLLLVNVLLGSCCVAALPAQAGSGERWRAATPAELEAALPARATVGHEHIETEMRTASGIIDSHKNVIAAVVLITAGYAADGKYSHYLLVQAPVRIDHHLLLEPGSYVVGWTRSQTGLAVHFFDSTTDVERGEGNAEPVAGHSRVESFHIWPPSERKGIQIGRFYLPYSIASEAP